MDDNSTSGTDGPNSSNTLGNASPISDRNDACCCSIRSLMLFFVADDDDDENDDVAVPTLLVGTVVPTTFAVAAVEAGNSNIKME